MRNDFAQVIEPIDFETKAIADRCKSLKLRAQLAPSFEDRAGSGSRGAFIRSGIQIVAYVLLNSQLILEESKLIAKYKSGLPKTAMATMRRSMKGKLPVTLA